MADSFDNFKPVYSAFGDHPRTPVTSTPSQNVPSLFSDYGQQLEGQGLFGPLQSSSSSGFAASGSNYAMDDYSFQNYSTSSVYDMSTRPLSPTNSSTGGGGPGNQSFQIGVVSPRPSSIAGEGGDAQKMGEASKSNIMSIINLLNEYVISHPFIVFRRQAQVNNRSVAYHLTPFTVVPFMWRIQGRQGIGAFFKGLPSSLVNYVLLIGSESLFYNILQYPIEYDFGLNQLFSERLVKHLILKSLSIIVVTPFICSSSVETVQSLIVAESPSPLDSIKEGFSRVFHFKSDRKLPFYMIVGPSVAYHLAHYILFSLTREALLYLNRQSQEDEEYLKQRRIRQRTAAKQAHLLTNDDFTILGESSQGIVDLTGDGERAAADAASTIANNDGLVSGTKDILNELKCSLYANIITDIVLYPLQTVMYRLFLQGTRTLIDNVDGRTAVIPLISNYDSASDCYASVLQYEGTSGLFKGFGALVLQYGVQAALIHLANYCLNKSF
ncbi:hypothetical protein TYRP_019332 [Tyrophagus putrescentiae]|nr:hypothetical protein TYRP_019332 [Tyrophagus putrescentiae]